MATARGQITIVDLNDAKTVNLYLSANHPTTQIFNQSGQTYVPSWTGNNALVITPELLISGVSTPRFSAAPTWKLNGTTVVSGTAISGFTPTIGTSTSNYALTLTGNMTDVDLLEITCSGTYTDTSLNANIPIKASITFTKSINTGQLCMARIDATGHVFKEEATGPTPDKIDLDATLIRGSEDDTTPADTTPYSVVWYRRDVSAQSGWSQITGTVYVSGSSGAKKYEVSGRRLTVYPDGVDSEDTFKAVVTDTYTASATYNKAFPATFTIVDLSDPFSLVIRSSNGDTFKNGNVSTTLTAQVQQGGIDVAAGVYTISYAWTKYNANGSVDTSFGTKTTQSINITSSDVTSRATFFCEATIA